MIQDVTDYPMSQLFDIEQSIVFAVPPYQREYSWNKEHWEKLFDDILDNDEGYYLGSIICINQTGDALKIPRLEVVDGQQRLTTISLLYASIYSYLNEKKEKFGEDERVELTNLKRKLILKKGNDELRMLPQRQNYNNDDYRAVLSEIRVIDKFDAPKYAGNRKIFRAYRYFKRRIEKLNNGDFENIVPVFEYLDKINNATVVKIEVKTHSDAYTLFESLNNTGLPLTAIDLIKNKLLANVGRSDEKILEKYFEKWMTLLEYLSDDYGIQERFFRQYYNAFKHEYEDSVKISLATRSNLIKIYEKLISTDSEKILTKLIDAGKSYSILIGNSQNSDYNIIEKSLKELSRIQGAPGYLLLLYLLEEKDTLKLSQENLKDIINLMVSFFVRRNLTDLPPTRDLIRLFMIIKDEVRLNKVDPIYDIIRNKLIDVSADDDQFEKKLKGPIYEENDGVTRFILCSIAEGGMTKETETDLWRVENKKYVWTIEHIFPQGEKIPQCWIDMIADGNEKLAKDYQEKYAHTLGNLTISGYNSTLGNKCFEEKRDRKDKNGNYVGYRNGLKLNEDLAKVEKWNIKQIEKRTEKSVKQTIELFKLEDK